MLFIWKQSGTTKQGEAGVGMEQDGRRKFLMTCLGGLLAASAGAAIYPLYLYLAPRQTNGSQQKISFAGTDIQPGGAKFFDFRGATGVVIRKAGGELAAFSAVCTHLGCIVQWQKEQQQFLCPCHAGRYTADGTVISGPPPKPLVRLPLAVDKGMITVG